MRVSVVGAGYVGLVSAACLADVGNFVRCIDRDPLKIEKLRRGIATIYEPHLEEILKRTITKSRIDFFESIAAGLADAEICLLAVDTPTLPDGSSDLRNILSAADELGKQIASPLLLVVKSTVPVGSTRMIAAAVADRIRERGLEPTELLSCAFCPEFLKEGDAVNDFTKPDRIIIGADDDMTVERLRELYRPFMRRGDRLISMGIESAELTKYAANSMLATRISFMNEMARFSEMVGADIGDVRRGIASDPRIGPDFLYAGLGYGGSCFPKDTSAIINIARAAASPLTLVEAAESSNLKQREWFWNKISSRFNASGGLRDKRIAIWGLAFKANTDDMRCAPSLDIIARLVTSGAQICAYDPVAQTTARLALGERASAVTFSNSAYEAAEGADALIICTEWLEFRSPDFALLKSKMKTPLIFDGRNLYSCDQLAREGFVYISVGRRDVDSREVKRDGI